MVVEASTEKNVLVVCPTCKKSAQVPVPTYIFDKKKSGIVKVQIHTGIVCEHQFVVYVDQNFMARGFEAIDFLLEVGTPVEPSTGEGGSVGTELDLRDVVAKFGSFATTHIFRAFVFNYPVVLVKSPTDAPDLEDKINNLFVKFIPEELSPEPLVEAIERNNFGKFKFGEDRHLVLDTDGIVLNSPWGMRKKKQMTWEEGLIERGLVGDDLDSYSGAIRGNIREFYKRATYVAGVLGESKRVFIKDLQKQLQKEFGMKHSNYQVELLETMIKRRFKNGPKLVKRIRRWQDNLAEILGGGN
ncbi:MAG: hypothetical protein ACTSU5_08130 [Promethearchaeota archaeon]